MVHAGIILWLRALNVLYASGQVSVEAFSGVSAMWHWCHRRARSRARDDSDHPLIKGLGPRFSRFAREQTGLGHKVAMYACAS
jgi:hypothetical protein